MPFRRGESSITPVGYHREYAGKHIAEPPKREFDIDARIRNEKESLSDLTKARNNLAKHYGPNDSRVKDAERSMEDARQQIKKYERMKKENG